AIETVLRNFGVSAPGKLGLTGDSERVDEELDVPLQQIGQLQQLIRLERALAIFDVGHRLPVVEAKALGELILRPALRLAGGLDAVADQLLRSTFEHGQSPQTLVLYSCEYNIAILSCER